MITKKARNLNNFKRQFSGTNSARNAWSIIIEHYKISYPNGKILLPSYIGWSPNEGSGIFDSVINSELDYDFYELDEKLNINFADLQDKLKRDLSQLVLLVHYFGFVDKNYDQIVDLLLENDIFFVEDCAHSWLSDIIGGECGRKGNFSFYSLHKLLPISNGGILVNNRNSDIKTSLNSINNPFFDLNYDLYSIYSIRRSNYLYLCERLEKIPSVNVIHKELGNNVCPQTLPVIINNYDRDKLYQEMNELGFGMVSLYHTMIKPLKNSTYKSASILSKGIINFPIHQDVNYTQIDEMVVKLKEKLNV